MSATSRTLPSGPRRGHTGPHRLFIVNPLTGGGLLSLFSTHPRTAERVRRLRAMAHGELVR